MSSLDRTVSFSEMDDIAVPISQYLELDMMRPLDIFFDEDAAVAEGGLGLARGDFHVLSQLIVGSDDAKPATAAAGARLDHDRVARLFCEGQGFFDTGNGTIRAGHDRNAG